MARKPRIDYPGAWHHVMNRGRHRERAFADDDDCVLFLDGVAEASASFGLETHVVELHARWANAPVLVAGLASREIVTVRAVHTRMQASK